MKLLAKSCLWGCDNCSFQLQRHQCNGHFTWTIGWSVCAHPCNERAGLQYDVDDNLQDVGGYGQ